MPSIRFARGRVGVAASRTTLIALLTIVATGAAAADEPQDTLVWFGSYTGAPPKAEGISVARLDLRTGRLSAPVLAATLKNPSFVALHPALPVLYAVSEVDDADGQRAGSLTALSIDRATGRLTPLNHQVTGRGTPCHVSVDRSGKAALAANYGGGSTVCLGIEADGRLRPLVAGTPGGHLQHVGHSVHPERQAAPHGHSIDPSPDGRFAISCDLGIDKVLVHALDVGRGTLAFHTAAPVKPGAGPRHFALHPDGRHAYCINELDLTVTAFDWDAANGSLTAIQSLSTLPDDVVERTGFSTAEIAVHPTGRFLYGSNRGHDSIAIYAIDTGTGRLTFRGVEPIRGRTPRNFAIDPTGRWLLAAGQDSHTVTVFRIDEDGGALTFTGQTVPVPAPVCVCFDRVAVR
ncbi:MAG: lactonase family protein [Planctomycetaceae bacterium]